MAKKIGKTQPPVSTPKTAPKSSVADRLGALEKKDAASHEGPPHVVVTARAGTGKTFTLVVGVAYAYRNKCRAWAEVCKQLGFTPEPSPQQLAVWEQLEKSNDARTIQFTAFNKSIVNEFSAKWSYMIRELGRAGVSFSFSTMHSCGFSAVRKNFQGVGVEEYRVRNIISEILERPSKDLMKDKPIVVLAAEKLVGLCKQNLVPLDIEDDNLEGEDWKGVYEALDELSAYYEVDLEDEDGRDFRDETYRLVPKVLSRCKEVATDNKIDFNDMIWLPTALGLQVFRNDLLLVDEAQDLNRAQQALAKAAGRRIVLCGDPKQAIYGFAGADCDSMPRMTKELGMQPRKVVDLPLTVTRRCGKAIVAEAKAIVPDFDAHETNPAGIISQMRYNTLTEVLASDDPLQPGDTVLNFPTYHRAVQDGDMILCRVNSPLVSQCFQFIRMGRKANIQGRDVAAGLIATVKKLWKDGMSRDGFINALDNWRDDEERKELAKKNPSEVRLMALADRHACLLVFLDNDSGVSEHNGKDVMMASIQRIFSDDKTTGIKLSSIHRAKGMESKRVFFLTPKGAECPHPMAKSAWQREQEMNLRYVAITRAIEELVYVS